MTPIQLALELKRLICSGKTFFMKCQPEVFDFTNPDFSGELLFFSATEELRLKVTKKELIPLLGLLNAALFSEKDFTILGWNIKSLASFVRFHTKAIFEWECKCFDLKVVEAFLGLRNNAPADLAEALVRTKKTMTDSSWPKAKTIWQKIHTPLIFDVIPSLEIQGIYNIKDRKALYSYYEIEGQVNGRLNCSKEYRNYFDPHTMGPEQRESFRPKGSDEVFMYLDYRNMEVTMLQWLSNDDRLGQVLALDEDFYTVVFKLVSGGTCDTEKKRDMCKNFILPIIYGASATSLAKELSLSQKTAENIVDRVYKLFPASLKWIKDFQDGVADVGTDYLGRKRYFDEGSRPVRNFAVQAPAALVCLEKLIALHNKLKGYARIACHIHDGYVVYVSKAALKMVADMAKDVLEQDSELCPGLKLRSSCKTGPTLAELRVLD